jgi:hypothetical protein
MERKVASDPRHYLRVINCDYAFSPNQLNHNSAIMNYQLEEIYK